MLTSVLDTSKHLVTALEKADWLDRILILSAFMFFVLVVLFIVKQRIVDRGIRIAFWWTRFLPDFSGDKDLMNMGDLENGSTVLEVTQSSASAVSTVIASALTTTMSVMTPLSSSRGHPPAMQESSGDDSESSTPTVLETTFTSVLASLTPEAMTTTPATTDSTARTPDSRVNVDEL